MDAQGHTNLRNPGENLQNLCAFLQNITKNWVKNSGPGAIRTPDLRHVRATS